MHPTMPMNRLCQSMNAVTAVTASLLFAAAAAFGSVEHRAKADETSLFRTRLLEPPPLTQLTQGEVVKMLVPGRNESLVGTAGGLRGWVRNRDLVAVKLARGESHHLPDLSIVSDGLAASPVILDLAPAKVQVEELDRSFDAEMIEAIDREQLEMRHDEN